MNKGYLSVDTDLIKVENSGLHQAEYSLSRCAILHSINEKEGDHGLSSTEMTRRDQESNKMQRNEKHPRQKMTSAGTHRVPVTGAQQIVVTKRDSG